MTKNKQFILNLASNLVVFITGIVINFFFAPYIVRTIGVEANGFIGLANSFTSYASLIAMALNSMAGRFISISIHRNNIEEANKYYSVVMVGNLLFSSAMLIVSGFCVFYLERIISIPPNLIWDVKLLFALTFLTFVVNAMFPVWGTATFITNRLYLSSIVSMVSQIIRVLTILGLFLCFVPPSAYFTAIAALLSSIFTILCSLHFKKKLVPELRFKKKNLELRSLKKLLASGIWNSVSQSGILLLSGIDLLIANLFIGPSEMGMLALAKSLPNVVSSLAGSVQAIFAPALTIYYAEDDKEGLRAELKRGMKTTAIMLTIPVSIIITHGREFYSLWVPSQDSSILQILSILTCAGIIFTSGIQSLYSVFMVTDKVKPNALLLLLSGVISTAAVFILLKTTNLGIFAIAGASTCVNLIRNMCYTVPFGAKYLNMKWNTFFPEVFTSVLSAILLVAIGMGVKFLLPVNSWGSLVLSCFVTGCIGLTVNILIVLNKSEKLYLITFIRKKISRGVE